MKGLDFAILAGAALLLLAPKSSAAVVRSPTPAPAVQLDNVAAQVAANVGLAAGPVAGPINPGPITSWFSSIKAQYPAIAAYAANFPTLGIYDYALANPSRAAAAESTLESYDYFQPDIVKASFNAIQNALNSINPGPGINTSGSYASGRDNQIPLTLVSGNW